ncbi:hypothetical protein ACIGQ5_22540 [Peribacillus frigoritolerans]|uniref:hypothetical protein n=1 Tax=Peribacillus frigoritolerans TaxID=450367 RepID=UPI0037C712D9
MDEKGLFIGDVKTSNMVVASSIKEKIENRLVLGKAGMGMGMNVYQSMIEESLKSGKRVLVIDPKAERGKCN